MNGVPGGAAVVATCACTKGDNAVNRFQTTRWSIVLHAGRETAGARAALAELCRTYRSPVIAYVRSRGSAADEAEDLGQAFFARFIEGAYHAQADPARGSFRAFLLTALKRFLEDAVDRAHAQKRGGNVQFQSLDSMGGDESEVENVADRDTPEQAFERAWAKAALRAAMHRLKAETAAAGRSELFDQLCEFLAERPSEADYERVAVALKMRRNTVAVAVHRLRQRLRELVQDELAETAVDKDGFNGELDRLRKSLATVMNSA
jgi:RNA polymerase sigma-70 factor (ECF subfamily)